MPDRLTELRLVQVDDCLAPRALGEQGVALQLRELVNAPPKAKRTAAALEGNLLVKHSLWYVGEIDHGGNV